MTADTTVTTETLAGAIAGTAAGLRERFLPLDNQSPRLTILQDMTTLAAFAPGQGEDAPQCDGQLVSGIDGVGERIDLLTTEAAIVICVSRGDAERVRAAVLAALNAEALCAGRGAAIEKGEGDA